MISYYNSVINNKYMIQCGFIRRCIASSDAVIIRYCMTSGAVWIHMRLYGFIKCFMTSYDAVWLHVMLCVWHHMVLYGFILFCMSFYDAVWLHVMLYGFSWCYMTLCDAIWIHMMCYDLCEFMTLCSVQGALSLETC